MRYIYLLFFLCLLSCDKDDNSLDSNSLINDTVRLKEMVLEREAAMKNKDIDKIMSQFALDATWINSHGYFFDNKSNVYDFHVALIHDANYEYEAGNTKVRILNEEFAIVYYGWKMYWLSETDTLKENGIMTLTARKINEDWFWIAVTNQHTPEFHMEITPNYTK